MPLIFWGGLSISLTRVDGPLDIAMQNVQTIITGGGRSEPTSRQIRLIIEVGNPSVTLLNALNIVSINALTSDL